MKYKYFPVIIFVIFTSCIKQQLEPVFTDNDISFRKEFVIVHDTDSAGIIYGDTIFSLFIPNGFSPDNDGINDFFGPVGIGVLPDQYSMKIYSRWKNMVFESNNFKHQWDGTIRKHNKPDMVFEYRISLFSKVYKNHEITGAVFIIR